MTNSIQHITQISGGLVFTGEDFTPGDIFIDRNRISKVSLQNRDISDEISRFTSIASCKVHNGVLDASGCYVIPGLVDIHFHGAVGADISDASVEGLHKIGKYEADNGVLAMCPATMTLPYSHLESALRAASKYVPADCESALVGINLEGPFISKDKLGAQNPKFVRSSSLDEFNKLQVASGGLVKILDIAPETDEAIDFISKVSHHVRVSLAHTNADYDTAKLAFEVGARQLTHMYNAMNGMHHRSPGPIPAAVERGDVDAELIADGVHVHPAMVRLAFKMFGDDHIILVSDSMRATGLGDGTFDLGGQDVNVKGNVATLVNGSLAGSVTNLMECVKNVVKQMDIPLVSAVKAATINPSRAIGIDGDYGSIAPGCFASIVLLDSATLHIKAIVCRGNLLQA